MKKIYLLAVVGTVSFALLQSVEAGSRGGGRSFGGGHSFGSARHFSAPTFRSAPSRSYASGSGRYYSSGRVSSMASYRGHNPNRTRFSSTTIARNPTYTSNARRWNGDRTTAFNSRQYTRSNTRLAAGNYRTTASRSNGFDRGRVIARHNGNWNRHWDRGRDHNWHGHRCHFRNGFWFVYDPFPFYPYGYGYGYGYYPYGDYYASSYYDDGYATDEYASAPNTEQPSSAGDSRVNEVQSALAREGYYDGAIDGHFGQGTRKALRRYQRDHGLQATGSIDRAVIQALRLR